MNKILGACTAALVACANAVLADGFYDLLGPQGDKWGEIAFEDVVGDYAVWVWPTEEGETLFYLYNPGASQGDWSQGEYEGYFVDDIPDQIATLCRNSVQDEYGDVYNAWGGVAMDWIASDEFELVTTRCSSRRIELDMVAIYSDGPSDFVPVYPVFATLGLQSYDLPISTQDKAFTVQGLDKNPAIYLDVEFSDGSVGGKDYQQYWAENIVFDDVSGDPYNLIEVVYWDIDSSDPGLGKYAAQLTSTGNGVGTAELYVSFRDAPHVTASVTANVVSAFSQMKVPVSSTLALQSYTLPLNRRDRSHTVSGLDLTPAIFVSAQFEDGSTVYNNYNQDFVENVIIDDVSGDPYNLIEVIEWPVDNNNSSAGTYAGQITSTGRGIGTANLFLSFKNAPGVTASVAVNVVSGAR